MSKLKNQAINSLAWTTIRTIAASISGPLLILIKTQYLSPAEFGVMALLNIVIGFLHVLENFGFSQAIIQRDNVTKDEKSSLFIFELFFSLLIGLIVIVISPTISNLFNMPSLRRLLSLLSIVIFINGPALLYTAFLEKDLHFKELSIIQIIKEFTMFASTFLFLYLGLGLTGVVFGQISAASVMTLLIMIVSHKNKLLSVSLHFRVLDIIPYLKFGIFVSSNQMMNFATNNIDEIIIGYFLSAETLGLYHFAKNMLGKLRTLMATSFSKVLFPILSKMKNDLTLLTKTYSRISKYLGAFTFPIFIGIALTAHLFVPLIFGDEWNGSVVFFQIFSLSFIPYVLTGNISSALLYSVGKPNLVFYTSLWSNVFYLIILFFVSYLNMGIYVIAIINALFIICRSLILQYLTSKHLHTTFIDYIKIFKITLMISLFLTLSVISVQLYFNRFNNNLIEFIASLFTGVLVFVIGMYFYEKSMLIEIKNIIFNR